MNLRRLDDRVLPVIARLLDRTQRRRPAPPPARPASPPSLPMRPTSPVPPAPAPPLEPPKLAPEPPRPAPAPKAAPAPAPRPAPAPAPAPASRPAPVVPARVVTPVPRPVPKAAAMPAGPAPFIRRLRQLDDRLASRGPLALVRELPQVGALVLATVLLVAGTTAGSLIGDARQRAADGIGQPGGPDTELPGEEPSLALGPAIGANVREYVESTRRQFLTEAFGAPDGRPFALVTFTAYLTPADAAAILDGYDVSTVFYKVPPPPPQRQVRSFDTSDVAALTNELARIAAELEAEAKALNDISATIDNDPDQKKSNEEEARALLAEAAKLRGPCACVFAAVVRGPLRQVALLLAEPGVRLVEAGPPDAALAELTLRPLLPEEKVTVTGGNEG